MSANWTKWGWGFIVLVAVTGVAWEIFADRADSEKTKKKPSVQVETLLPADTVVYARFDGAKKHAAAWQKTAASEALEAARAEELLEKFVLFLKQQAAGTYDSRIETLVKHLKDHGGSLAVSVPPGLPIPKATLVLNHAAGHVELVSEITTVLAENNIKSEIQTLEGRKVHIAHLLENPAIDLAWWAEGGHLVIAAGVAPAQQVLSVASGKQKNITTHRLWPKPNTDKQRTVTSTVWVDGLALRERYGQFPIPVPDAKPVVINDALKILGLDTVEELVVESGYEGKALWSESRLKVPGQRTGLLSMLDGKTLTFDDLPPLPATTNSFMATSLDVGASYATLRRIVRESMAFGPDEAAQQVEGAIDMIPGILGFDPKSDLLDHLGRTIVICDDPEQGFFGTGGTLIVQVKDPKKLRQTFENIFTKINTLAPNEEPLNVHRTKKLGREIWTFEFGNTLHSFCIAIDEKWMVVAFMPQPVEAFFLRMEGKLLTWSKEQLQKEGAPVVPEKFTTLGVSSPRVIYQSLLKLAPYGMSALIVALKEDGVLPRKSVLPWTLADLPPAELIGGPLFPNVRTITSDETGIRWTSRSSLPSLPIVGGPGSGSGPVAGAVVTALVLPAVQQAREAARRTQSKNNLKQLGLAMHNYHDVHKSFPTGTLPNEKLKPDERLSFMVELLPFLEQAPLYKKIDKEGGWEDKEHRAVMETRVPVLLNPSIPMMSTDNKYAPTHYVGLAGLGKDAALLPITSKRAGVFGYNRKTRFRDITDGTSNTIMISEASKDFGAWGAGGSATIRSLTKKRYINGPDGIGSPFAGGCNMLLGDGSVRFISQNINANTLEALVTIRGGEVVGDF